MGIKKAAARRVGKSATRDVRQAADKISDTGPMDRLEDAADDATEDLGRKAIKKARK